MKNVWLLTKVHAGDEVPVAAFPTKAAAESYRDSHPLSEDRDSMGYRYEYWEDPFEIELHEGDV